MVFSAEDQAEFYRLGNRTNELRASADNVWLLITSFVILFMQTGFLLLEAGSVRAKNARSIMIKNLCDACYGGLAWYFVGFYVSGGTPMTDDHNDFVGWIQAYAFAMTTCTIVSGGVASRMKFLPYMMYSGLMCAWIYPIIASWAWSDDGWLAQMGYLDFAGSGPVHAIGGASALVGAMSLGPRLGRFSSSGRDRGIKGHSDALVVLGALILWFGWFSFNAGSGGGTSTEQLQASQRAAMNTLVTSTVAGLVGFIFCVKIVGHHDITIIVNSILGGLVAITAGCAFIDTWAATICGVISAPVTFFGSQLLSKRLIDDPLDATPVHLFNGILGVILTGIFHSTEGLIAGESRLFIAQVVGASTMLVWSGIHAIAFFYGLRMVMTIRVHKDDELLGLDFKYCDGYAYDHLDADAISEHTQVKQAEKRLKARAAEMSTTNSSAPLSSHE